MYSSLLKNIDEAGSIRINQMVYEKKSRKEDVTVLSLGEAFFKIPMFDFGPTDFEAGYHYADSRGTPELRAKIAGYYRNHFGVEANPDKNILISAGSKIIIYMAILALVDEGDEVLVHEPYWLSYPEQVKLCRGAPKVIPYWEKPENFKKYITPKTKLLILNSPNNPAGYVYSFDELKAVHALCQANDAYLLVDEAYGDFVTEDGFTSVGKVNNSFQNIILVNSLSKSQGMSGWRMGYMISHETLIKHVLRLNQHLITCAPTVLMRYIAHYFDEIQKITFPQAQAVVRKRKLISKVMDEIGIARLPGESTFYFMIDISRSGKSSQDFAESLLKEHSIAVVPGLCYGPNLDKFVRIGVGAESEERIVAALKVIRASFKD